MKLIALDDGHGMETAGKRTPYIESLGREIRENEFNREVVRYLDEELQRCGFRTLLVAPTDEDTPLKTRTDRANAANADLYISIHFNAYDSDFSAPTPNGFSAHVYPGYKNKEAGRFASIALKHLANGTKQNNRGIFEDNFHVLRETKMTAVLFELGFMDYLPEALLMLNVEFQRECAREIAQAVCEFYGVTYIEETPQPTPEESTSEVYWRVVAGSYKNKELAIKLANELKTKGFSTFLVPYKTS